MAASQSKPLPVRSSRLLVNVGIQDPNVMCRMNEMVACVFLRICCKEPESAHNHAQVPTTPLLTFLLRRGTDETHNETAYQSRISGSKNASAPETKRGTNDRRPHRADRRLLGAGVFFSGSSQPHRESFADPRAPLRIPGVGRATGSLTASDSVSKLNMS